jgi:starch-binding outer membrane protein, SusD/RagB family
MKQLIYTAAFVCTLLALSCKKVTDLAPESNLNTETYYSNVEEVKAALNACYSGMRKPLAVEWQLTELRSDNSKQGVPGSTSSTNRDLSDVDMFLITPSHAANTTYWQTTYANIRSLNIVLEKLGVVYDPAAGTISFQNVGITITDADRKQLGGEALIMRAYHYFNLVRLYSGVFLVHKTITPAESKTMNRVSVDEIYKLIEADLTTAAANMSTAKYSGITANDLGRVNGWTAKALLGKVYLTRNKKAEAITVLQDVRTNSGYGLQTSYASVFSVSNEMNNEILFAVRYKAPALGQGSPFANLFAPLQSGSNVVVGDGDGLNYPTAELDTASNGDGRKATFLGVFGTGTNAKLYVKKYIPPQPSVNDDAENDWPVLRFPDVLLMLAEAQGYTQASLDLMNQLRTRASLPAYTMGTVTSVAQFEQALSNERRMELAFENQRWFDLVRFNTTLTTITAEQTIKNHFAREFQSHYRLYVAPVLTLAQLQSNVTREHLLLPIPQREIDTNTFLVIPQNPGY